MQIIVLGMHRSGSSAVTRLMAGMGAFLGEPGKLLAPNPDNPKGFWERVDVIAINRALLREGNSTWFKVDEFEASRPAPPALVQAMQGVIRELAGHAVWAMKDPRLCLTLPYWLGELQEPRTVVVSRHPGSVARSLELRNRMPVEYGMALWEFHAVGIIRHARDLRKIFVRFEELLESPQEVTAALAGELGLRLEEDALGLIDGALPRASVQDYPLTPHQRRLYDMLRGDAVFDAEVLVSQEARRVMEAMGTVVSGSPVKR